MTTSNYFKAMLLISWLPGLVARPLVGCLRLYLAHADCRTGKHTQAMPDANYCAGCGKLLNAAAWRRWTVALRDGSYRVVSATNEAHARNLVRYGEIAPGQMDARAAQQGRLKVADENIVSCTPGQIAGDTLSSAKDM